VFDLPFFFCRGADRMRVLTNLLSFAFDSVEARPKAVNLQLVNTQVRWLPKECCSGCYSVVHWCCGFGLCKG
jgi:hypothetical protein